jgi:hypothetical protein
VKRVLVVEDNEMNMQLVEFLLEEGGYEIVKAASGEEAMAVARGGEPVDLILMDIHLPGVDGLSVVQELKKDARTSSIPILAPPRPMMETSSPVLPSVRLGTCVSPAREDADRLYAGRTDLALLGLMGLAFTVLSARDRSNPKRLGNAALGEVFPGYSSFNFGGVVKG